MRFPSLPKFAGIQKFVKGVLADDGGDPSAKRTGFFIFIALIVICTIAGVFAKLTIPAMIWNGLVDLVKWIGTAILGERVPSMLAAFKSGNQPKDDGKPDDPVKKSDEKASVIP